MTRLTLRQTDVLSCVARAFSNAEIAMALDISEKTVKIHVSAVLRAMDVPNRTAAALAFHGLSWGPDAPETACNDADPVCSDCGLPVDSAEEPCPVCMDLDADDDFSDRDTYAADQD